MRELFTYYRVRVDQTELALRAALAVQARLRAAVPHLEARLLRRPEASEGFETWMETYAIAARHHAAGIDAGLQALIESEACALQPWTCGARHTEAFVACA